MRTMRPMLWVLMLLIGIHSLTAQQKGHKFAVKSGYVEYEIEGAVKGRKLLWWDDYGAKSRIEEEKVHEFEVMGRRIVERTHTVDVIRDGKYWHADLLAKTGNKGTLPAWAGLFSYQNLTEAEQKKMEQDILEAFGGKQVGKERLLGYECDVIEVLGAKSWVHQGVTLKVVAEVAGISLTERATKFTKNLVIPAHRFEPPAGIEYEDHDEFMFGDDDDSGDVVPVSYPFEKFREIARGFNHKGYRSVMVIAEEGEYLASFMRGMTTLNVVASSEEEVEELIDEEDFETFRHKGRTYFFGTLEDMDEGMQGTFLIEHYPAHKMYITFLAVPNLSKEELLEISDKLRF